MAMGVALRENMATKGKKNSHYPLLAVFTHYPLLAVFTRITPQVKSFSTNNIQKRTLLGLFYYKNSYKAHTFPHKFNGKNLRCQKG